ncbi:MAG: (E)-4-hydroxy-3-methylbut-2-enyl-diphosphate synthase [Bacteroidota bacterium]|nr:MAG: (E)-4-hydroxy-3-methylbut-2-enyl-diphosphate synthase [Bacteroidota bacterium]
MYCSNLYHFQRRSSNEVKVGKISIGGIAPLVVQTMTSTPTSNISLTVEQIIRSIKAGAKLVRITVPSMNDVNYLAEIKKQLRAKGFDTPLVADVHFNQKIAFEAARVVEKVRINPGNFADSKKFNQVDYTEEQYQNELARIRSEFNPLLKICRQHQTALRIGTNHGSLSDRIMSRFGDTPEGMAESAMEFLRICHEANFNDVVVSMKASNTLVMVQAVRLLVHSMEAENMHYPLHLGVTEAGEGEDGRIKSAIGIGALLADGIGDTIRVSLTEEPECEIPVAEKLLSLFEGMENHSKIQAPLSYPLNPYQFSRRKTSKVLNIGAEMPPIVVILRSAEFLQDLNPDYLLNEITSEGLSFSTTVSIPLQERERLLSKTGVPYPIVDAQHPDLGKHTGVAFLRVYAEDLTEEILNRLSGLEEKVIVLFTSNINVTAALRAAILRMWEASVRLPVIVSFKMDDADLERFQLHAAASLGALLLDGLCDGIWLENSLINPLDIASTAFGILQASRLRVSRPEYISCPSCGRTQFNIQKTTRQIREKTAHLKGLKIGIMGCIVNGLGEMADADYGYIGGAPGKVNLYHRKELIKKGVPEESALDELIELIKQNNDWIEP